MKIVPTQSPRVNVLGEGMLELRREGSGWKVGYGGDTINLAVHLARSGLDVSYVSALGDDPFSADLRSAWEAEGVQTGLVRAIPEALPGLYAIHVDGTGERTFRYWRRDSAATRFLSEPSDDLLSRAAEADVLVYSLITLAVLPASSRELLFSLCANVRSKGGKVVFDGNYRPLLWPDIETARVARDRAVSCCDLGLPTQADEQAMGERGGAAATAKRWMALGAREVAVKLGADGCLVDGAVVAPDLVSDVVDTSGAGDAFDAGYLAARIAGVPPGEAALAGHRLAGWVIRRSGAIPAIDAEAPYGAHAQSRGP